VLFYYLHEFESGRRSTIWNFLSTNERRIKKSFADNERVAWYKNQRFAKSVPQEGWYLIHTRVRGLSVGVLTGSYSSGPRERRAPASVYIYAMLLNRDLFRGKYVLTSDKNDKNHLKVLVGRPSGKINIISTISPNLGIAPEIKPDIRR